MAKEDIILKIKKLEDQGKVDQEQAEKTATEIVAKARTDSIDLIENFEENREAYLEKKVEAERAETQKETGKIIKKAEADTKKLSEKARKNLTNVVNSLFTDFKKRITE